MALVSSLASSSLDDECGGVVGSPDGAGPAGQIGICLLGTAACDVGIDSSEILEIVSIADAGRWGGTGRVRAMVAMITLLRAAALCRQLGKYIQSMVVNFSGLLIS